MEVLDLAPPAPPNPPSTPPAPPRPYLLPANGTHRHRPLGAWWLRIGLHFCNSTPTLTSAYIYTHARTYNTTNTAYLAWTIRLRGQLQRKLFGSGNASAVEAAALEPWLNAWAKRLSGAYG